MKSSSSGGNNSSIYSTLTVVDKENTFTFSSSSKSSNNLHSRNRTKKKYTQAHEKEESSEAEEPKVTIKMTLSARLEAIEQKLSKLQYLKDETIDEFSSLLNELNELVPILNQLIPDGEEEPMGNESSGLSKLLNRLQKLQYEYQKRRSVTEKRFNFRIDAVKERYAADVLHNKNESESEVAETSVALIHKQMAKIHTGSSINSYSSKPDDANTSSSVISARKRSLPAINHLSSQSHCPPVIKMARRQSVAAYPQNPINLSNSKSREITDSSILNLNLVTSKSVADVDLLAIKSRISKALKR